MSWLQCYDIIRGLLNKVFTFELVAKTHFVLFSEKVCSYNQGFLATKCSCDDCTQLVTILLALKGEQRSAVEQVHCVNSATGWRGGHTADRMIEGQQ